MRLLIAAIALVLVAGCAYAPPTCHTAGEDYTAADACH
jgi:hypothetical protein